MTRVAKGNPVCKDALQLKATTARRGNDPDLDVALFQKLFQKQNVHFTIAVPVVPCKLSQPGHLGSGSGLKKQ